MATAPKKPPAKAKTSEGFSDFEKDAMKARARELKSAKKGGDGEAELKAKIAEFAPAEAAMATRLHELVMAAAPGLEPKTWYGMPAWYKDGKPLCHFVNSSKFKTRYATFGFSEQAKLDDGDLWPNAFALIRLTPAVEARITALVKQAVG
ncbi:MAG: iron chaperone [Bauldia sp.]